jgi:hypothetical protein
VTATVLPGDVLAVRTDGFAAEAIRLGAALLGHPDISNHIAIVHHTDTKGTVWCIEGRPGGVGWRDASDYLSSRWTLTNASQPKTADQRKLIAKTSEYMLGTAYDWAAIAGDGLEDLHLWDPVKGVVHGETVCSALAAYAYDQARVLRPIGGERAVQPADWDTWILTAGWLPG